MELTRHVGRVLLTLTLVLIRRSSYLIDVLSRYLLGHPSNIYAPAIYNIDQASKCGDATLPISKYVIGKCRDLPEDGHNLVMIGHTYYSDIFLGSRCSEDSCLNPLRETACIAGLSPGPVRINESLYFSCSSNFFSTQHFFVDHKS